MARVLAPNRTYNGISAGVRFTAGVGETHNPAALAYFRRAGYELIYPESAGGPHGGGPAVKAPANDPVSSSTGEAGPPSTKPLGRMNKAELQAIAAELGLDLEGSNRELAERITAKRAEA